PLPPRAGGRSTGNALARGGAARAGGGELDVAPRPPRARGPGRERAQRARARVLERPLAERDCGLPEHPARHRQDEDAERARPPGRRPREGAGVMTRPPEFDELLGPDVPAEERARLQRVHDLLVEAGPPPALPPALAH